MVHAAKRDLLYLFIFRLNARKINTTFAAAAAAFFGEDVFVHHSSNVKQGARK